MRIAISGYYGCGNTGDEAVLAGIIESFKRRAPNQAEFTVLSADTADTQRRHSLAAVDRMNMTVVRRTLKESDLLISGGGSLLQDATSMRSLLYYLWVMRLAAKCGTPFMLYAQGIGPLRRPISRILTRLVANRAAYVTIRDDESAQLLRQIGVSSPKIEVTADPAFALQPVERARALELLRNAGADLDRLSLGIALRPWPGIEAAIPTYARLIDIAADGLGAQAVFLPLQPPGDLDLSDRVAGAMKAPSIVLRQPMSPCEMLGVSNALSALVAMRLHALIFGAMCAIPMLALSYDPKVRSLMSGLHQSDYTIDIAELNAEEAGAKLQSACHRRESIVDALRHVAEQRAELALVNVDRALACCNTR